jgi:hypothetical protein
MSLCVKSWILSAILENLKPQKPRVQIVKAMFHFRFSLFASVAHFSNVVLKVIFPTEGQKLPALVVSDQKHFVTAIISESCVKHFEKYDILLFSFATHFSTLFYFHLCIEL